MRDRRPRRSGAWRASWRQPRARRCTRASAPAPRSSGRWRAGWSTCSTCSPATSTARAVRCSRWPRPGSATRPAPPAAARARAWGAGTAACAGCPRPTASCRSACLAEEIDTPGEGQVRALVTVAGNPVVSTPNSDRLESAIESLDFMLAVDIYVNETTRHADVDAAGPAAAREVALRPGALPARGAQRGELLAAGVRALRAGRVGGLPAAGRGVRGRRGRTPTARRSTTW